MKIKLVCSLTLLVLIACSSVIIRADENNLDLDTDKLQNKNERRYSLTDINGYDIFTDDSKAYLNRLNEAKESKSTYIKKSLFTDENLIDKNEGEKKGTLFLEPIKYDAPLESEETIVSMEYIVICCAIVLGVITFVGTRKYYKRKGHLEDENNFDFQD